MNKIRVALVEDDNLTRLALRTALSDHQEIDWVGEASNGSEGLELIQINHPDVAIVDLGLPEIDGIELTRQWRIFSHKMNTPKTKILILTLRDSPEDVMTAFTAGADSYCMKDISLELLLEAIKATHEGNTWLDPAIARIIISQIQPFNGSESPSVQSNPHPLTSSKYKPLEENSALTERELQVLQLIVDGYSNAAIAEQLVITVGTVKTHVRNILNKLSAEDRTQAAVRALREGLAV